MRPTRRSTPVLALTLTLAILVLGGYAWLRAGTETAEDAPETATVTRQSLERAITATGVIRPLVGAEVEVGSRVSGIVRSIPVAIGDRVERGDLLARIDPTELRAQLDQSRADRLLAEAQLALATSSFERASALAADGILSAGELDSATRDLAVARARLELERARLESSEITLGYTEIRAPIRGIVADVTTQEGETVAASFAAPTFVTIVDLERLEVLAYVDETDVGQVSVGQRGTFSVDAYPGAEVPARVTAIDPKAEILNGIVNYVVRMAIEPRNLEDDGADLLLRPEMTAHVRLLVERREQVLTVPRRTVRRRAGRQLVTVLRDGAWVGQEIEPGFRTDRLVEVLEGLDEGEIVQLNQE